MRLLTIVSGISPSNSKLATWPSAWTPASVRPATVSAMLSRRSAIASARSISACTDGPFSCRAQPLKGVPSYSMSRRQITRPDR